MTDEPPAVVDRVATDRGEVVLRRAGSHYEIVSNGVFLMDTRGGESERLLVTAGLAACRSPRPRVLIGGLGVGFSLAAAHAHPAVSAITVVEVEPVLRVWHQRHLRHLTGVALADPRVEVVTADLLAWLRESDASVDVLCLDVDNGPHWTVSDSNAGLYDRAGTGLLADRLADGGALTVWSAAPVPAYADLLRERFGTVEEHLVPARRGAPDAVYVACHPRR